MREEKVVVLTCLILALASAAPAAAPTAAQSNETKTQKNVNVANLVILAADAGFFILACTVGNMVFCKCCRKMCCKWQDRTIAAWNTAFALIALGVFGWTLLGATSSTASNSLVGLSGIMFFFNGYAAYKGWKKIAQDDVAQNRPGSMNAGAAVRMGVQGQQPGQQAPLMGVPVQQTVQYQPQVAVRCHPGDPSIPRIPSLADLTRTSSTGIQNVPQAPVTPHHNSDMFNSLKDLSSLNNATASYSGANAFALMNVATAQRGAQPTVAVQRTKSTNQAPPSYEEAVHQATA